MASDYSVEAFLAREQEQLAGIDDEFGALTTNDSVPSNLNGFNEPALDIELEKSSPPQEENFFDNEPQPPPVTNGNFPHEVVEDAVVGEEPAVPATLSALPLHQQAAMRRVATPTPPPTREEPAKIKNWREQQKERLEKKDANEEQEKKKLREQAKRELDEWYNNRKDQLDKSMKRNRDSEKESTTERESAQPGQEWDRVVRMCEFNPKYARANKDLSRMRSILVQMKNQPQQPKSGK